MLNQKYVPLWLFVGYGIVIELSFKVHLHVMSNKEDLSKLSWDLKLSCYFQYDLQHSVEIQILGCILARYLVTDLQRNQEKIKIFW